MVTHFIIYIGLPGSGKTTAALATMAQHPEALLLDDLCLDIAGGAKKYKEMQPQTVVITDPRMCAATEENIKNTIIKTFGCSEESIFDFYYFENDPEACIINARRNPKPLGTENFIKTFTKTYSIPANATVIPVYKEK